MTQHRKWIPGTARRRALLTGIAALLWKKEVEKYRKLIAEAHIEA